MIEPEYLHDSQVGAERDRAIRALLVECFPNETRFAAQRYCYEMPAHRFMIERQGTLIAHMALHDKCIGTEAGEIEVVGVAEVAVAAETRGQGYAKILLEAGHRFAAGRGIQIALLFGDPRYYVSSGYTAVTNPIRVFDIATEAWKTELNPGLMMKAFGPGAGLPAGLLDLRGPTF